MSALGEYPGTWTELPLPRDHALPLQFQEKLSPCILLRREDTRSVPLRSQDSAQGARLWMEVKGQAVLPDTPLIGGPLL